jgi:magnesium-transporting ATPase (P-type)
LIAVIIVAAVTATNDYRKQLQFRALNDASKAHVEVRVQRRGLPQVIGTTAVVVGDIVYLGMCRQLASHFE